MKYYPLELFWSEEDEGYLALVPDLPGCNARGKSTMMTHTEMVNQMLQNPQVKAEYEALEPEFALLDELLRARQRAGLTPKEVAQRIGTPIRVITRLEAGIGEKYSPSVTTLRKYAEAVGCRLEIKLVPR